MRGGRTRVAAFVLPLLALAGVTAAGGPGSEPGPPVVHPTGRVDARLESSALSENAMSLDVESPAFGRGEPIPTRYTCDGQDVSPPLRWSGVPDSAVTLAVLAEDPDAPHGLWVHWVLYGLEASRSGLPEGVPTHEAVLDGALQGRNDFRKIGYGGPCPPAGQRHRYFFRIYALDERPDLGAAATRSELLAAIEGHVVAEGALMGTYRRR